MSMNANAKPFVFNPTASSWAPPSSAQTTQATSTQSQSSADISAAVPSETPAEPEIEASEDVVGDDDIDENDPLWKETLKLACGDRAKALKMLEDPDALMHYPEIKAIMLGSSPDSVDDWESSAADSADIKVEKTEDEEIAIASLSISAPSAVNSTTVTAAASDPVEVVEEDESLEDDDARNHLNIVFIGHVDAGKSTLSGSILYIMGMVDKRTIERYEREAKERNRESWFLAFIMDTSEEERAKGITVEVGRAHFETAVHRYTILDAPGHKNYVPNMIAGAAQADIGILVISARRGEFETGFERGGQTREHALLAKTLGVRYLIVVINKMDDPTVEWDVNRYEECVGKLKPYLKQCGYAIKKDVRFLPISALCGHNILNEVPTETCSWWKDMYTTCAHNTSSPTLLGLLDSLTISGRDADGPLRIPCLDRYFERGCVAMGKIESGTLRTGDEILISPTKKRTKIEGIYINEKKVRSAKPGENVLIKLGINVEDIQKGYIISSPLSPCPSVVEVKVQLALVDMLEHRPIFSQGYEAVMHIHTAEIEVVCARLVSVVDKKTQRSIVRPFARQSQLCTAILTTPLLTCMDLYENNPAIGRFTLRDEGKTIAIGKIVGLVR